MKKLSTYLMLLAFSSTVLLGCGSSKKTNKGILGGTNIGGSVAKTVATVVGLILLSKLLKSVLNTIGSSTSFASLAQNQQFTSSFDENTKLSSFAYNDIMKMSLQVLVAERYKIPLTKVMSNYSQMQTAGDLATFIGQNADSKILERIK